MRLSADVVSLTVAMSYYMTGPIGGVASEAWRDSNPSVVSKVSEAKDPTFTLQFSQEEVIYSRWFVSSVAATTRFVRGFLDSI